MVLTTYTLDIGNEKALDAFDTVTHIAYGISTITGTTDPTDTGLQAKHIEGLLRVKLKTL